MTLRDMTPDELELFEEEIVLGSAEREPARDSDRAEIGCEPDCDRDSTADGTAWDAGKRRT